MSVKVLHEKCKKQGNIFFESYLTDITNHHHLHHVRPLPDVCVTPKLFGYQYVYTNDLRIVPPLLSTGNLKSAELVVGSQVIFQKGSVYGSVTFTLGGQTDTSIFITSLVPLYGDQQLIVITLTIFACESGM